MHVKVAASAVAQQQHTDWISCCLTCLWSVAQHVIKPNTGPSQGCLVYQLCDNKRDPSVKG